MMVGMSTTIRANRRRLNGELSQVAFQMPTAHRRQMQAIAEHHRWPESEALRQAVALYLLQHRDLLKVLSPDLSATDSNGHQD